MSLVRPRGGSSDARQAAAGPAPAQSCTMQAMNVYSVQLHTDTSIVYTVAEHIRLHEAEVSGSALRADVIC